MKTKTDNSIERRGAGRPKLGDRVETTLRLERKLHKRIASLARRKWKVKGKGKGKGKRRSINSVCVMAIEFWLKWRRTVRVLTKDSLTTSEEVAIRKKILAALGQQDLPPT